LYDPEKGEQQNFNKPLPSLKRRLHITKGVELAGSTATLVTVYQAARLHVPKYCNLYARKGLRISKYITGSSAITR
jgi:hypothetical protein